MFSISTCLHIACGVLVHCETPMRLVSKNFPAMFGTNRLSTSRGALVHREMLGKTSNAPMKSNRANCAMSHKTSSHLKRQASSNMRVAVEQPAHAGGV